MEVAIRQNMLVPTHVAIYFAKKLARVVRRVFANVGKLGCSIKTFFEQQHMEYSYNIFFRIILAIENNDLETAKMLIKSYPHYLNVVFNSSGYTLFLLACAKANTELVEFMIEHGGDVNSQTFDNESAFYLAFSCLLQKRALRDASCIRELHKHGADINATNGLNLTPLQVAAKFGHIGLSQWLINMNARIDTEPHPYAIAREQGYRFFNTAAQIETMLKERKAANKELT